MKIVNKRKFITRIIELVVLIATLVLTPISINYANAVRGYSSMGGEYLVPVLGALVLLVIETVYEEVENGQSR